METRGGRQKVWGPGRLSGGRSSPGPPFGRLGSCPGSRAGGSNFLGDAARGVSLGGDLLGGESQHLPKLQIFLRSRWFRSPSPLGPLFCTPRAMVPDPGSARAKPFDIKGLGHDRHGRRVVPVRRHPRLQRPIEWSASVHPCESATGGLCARDESAPGTPDPGRPPPWATRTWCPPSRALRENGCSPCYKSACLTPCASGCIAPTRS